MTAKTKCGDINIGGDGIARACDKAAGHKGWHGESVRLHGSGDSTYLSETNWGDDGKGIHASKGRSYDGRTWVKA